MSLKKIFFKQVTKLWEMEEVYRIRYRIYGEELRIIDPQKYPDKMICDEFDKYSVHFAAFSEKKMIGVIRIVEDKEYGLPLEASFKDFRNFVKNGKKNAEFTRMMILPEVRKTLVSGKIFLGLMKLGFIYVLSVNARYIAAHCYTDDEFTPIEFLKNLGFKQLCEPYMEERLYGGYRHLITVLVLDINDLFKLLDLNDPKLAKLSSFFSYVENKNNVNAVPLEIDFKNHIWSMDELFSFPIMKR